MTLTPFVPGYVSSLVLALVGRPARRGAEPSGLASLAGLVAPVVLMTCLLGGLAAASDDSTVLQGRGLYWRHTPEKLATDGYPDRQHESYFWPDGSEGVWGILHDEEGIPYGPNTYFHWETPLDHPEFALTDSTIAGRWFVMNRGPQHLVRSQVRFMELMDLAYHEIRTLLDVEPPSRLQVYCPVDLAEYQRVAGVGYWVTGVVVGAHIVVEPPHVLYRRDLWAHAARNAVTQALLDLKCHGLTPPWFREGLAAYLAEEGNELLNYVNVYRPGVERVLWPLEETTRHVYPLADVVNGRIAIYNSFLMVWHLAETRGFDKIHAVLDFVEEGRGFERAMETVYGMPYQEILAAIDPRVTGEPITTPRFRWRDP